MLIWVLYMKKKEKKKRCKWKKWWAVIKELTGILLGWVGPLVLLPPLKPPTPPSKSDSLRPLSAAGAAAGDAHSNRLLLLSLFYFILLAYSSEIVEKRFTIFRVRWNENGTWCRFPIWPPGLNEVQGQGSNTHTGFDFEDDVLNVITVLIDINKQKTCVNK